MKTREPDILPNHKNGPLEDADQELDEETGVSGFTKSRVACVCPGCGKIHTMKMKWIGRGVPRKFCQSCRDRGTPLDGED
jgi:transposase-like protein